MEGLVRGPVVKYRLACHAIACELMYNSSPGYFSKPIFFKSAMNLGSLRRSSQSGSTFRVTHRKFRCSWEIVCPIMIAMVRLSPFQWPSADNVRITMSGMFIVFARCITLKIVQNLEVLEQFPEAKFFDEVNECTAVFLPPVCVWLNRSGRPLVAFQLGIQVVPRRHDHDPTRLHRTFDPGEHRLKLALLHAAEDEDARNYIVGIRGISVLKNIPLENVQVRKPMILAICAQTTEIVRVPIDRSDAEPLARVICTVGPFAATEVQYSFPLAIPKGSFDQRVWFEWKLKPVSYLKIQSRTSVSIQRVNIACLACDAIVRLFAVP